MQSGASSAVIANVVAKSTRGDEGDNDGSWRGKVYHQSSPANFLAVAIPKQTCASCMNL